MMNKLNILLFLFTFLSYPVFAEIVQEKIQTGIGKFYNAEFQESIQILQDVLGEESLQPTELHRVHLFIAFSKIRLDYVQENINIHLREAIRALPEKKLDPEKYPPDLYETYQDVRNNLVGMFYVDSNPSNASLVSVNMKTDELQEQTTPFCFTILKDTQYSLIVSKTGWQAESRTIHISPGQSDSLLVSLSSAKESFFKRYWPYGAGIVLSGILIYSQLNKDDSQPDLPLPPERPQ